MISKEDMEYFMCVKLEFVSALEWKIKEIDNVSYLDLKDCKKRAKYYQALEDEVKLGLWMTFSNSEIEKFKKNWINN